MAAMTLQWKSIIPIIMFMVLGTWAYTATSRITLHEASIARHELWMAQHRRVYTDNAEKERRFKIFKDNAEFIEKFNNEGNHTYKLSLNKFADLTDEEFIRSHTGYKKSTFSKSSKMNSFNFPNLTKNYVPSRVDWREIGAVTPIKEQGQCGSCWAFAAVAAVEGITHIFTGKLISLSEQELVDCTNGCNPSTTVSALEYIKTHGITSEANYQYTGTNATCDTDKSKDVAARITGSLRVFPSHDEEALQEAVFQQPVTASVEATGTAFRFYSGGVFSGDCGTETDHAVTIVGYGTSEDDGTKYWLVKNSWGEGWGEGGYMRIRKDVGTPEGLCGIATQTFYPINTFDINA